MIESGVTYHLATIHRRSRRGRQLALAAIACALSASAHADVALEERVAVSGAMKMMNMTGVTVTTIAGDRARTQSRLQFESGLMRTLSGGAGQSAEIVRLDQDRIYTLDLRKKTYTETTFAAQRAQFEVARQQGQSPQADSGVDESECEWSEPKGEVTRTGSKASIAGFDAEQVTITATQSCTSRKTGQVCDFGLTLDQWLSADFPAAAETLAYRQAYAEKMGFGAAGSRDFAERAQTMFGRYEGIWSEVAKHMRDVKGHPVKAGFVLGLGGPQCSDAQGERPAAGSATAPSVAGAIGGTLGGALGGMFNKKKDKEPEAAPQPPPLPGGLLPLMSISTELVSVSTAGADAQLFEIPAGYNKKD